MLDETIKPKKKKKNYSKLHETAIRDACKRVPDVICERLFDTMGMQKNVKQPSDFIFYHFPTIFYAEAKTTDGNKLPMSNISDFQWKSLIERSKIKGVCCGIIIEYRHSEDQNTVVFVDIEYLKKIRYREGKKYIESEEALQNGIQIETKKKKVNWSYDMKKFFSEMFKKRL